MPASSARARPRRALAVALALALALCATAPAPSQARATSPQSQVRSAWSQLKAVIMSANARRYCSLLTSHARRQLIGNVHDGCEQAAKVFLSRADPTLETQRGWNHAQIKFITGRGDRINVIAGAPDGSSVTHFVKLAGHWKVNDMSTTVIPGRSRRARGELDTGRTGQAPMHGR